MNNELGGGVGGGDDAADGGRCRRWRESLPLIGLLDVEVSDIGYVGIIHIIAKHWLRKVSARRRTSTQFKADHS